VGGFSITTQPVDVRRAIGYVPQAVSVDRSLTGYENLLLFAKLYDIPHKEQAARIGERLEFVGLNPEAGRMVDQYSDVSHGIWTGYIGSFLNQVRNC